MNLMMIKDKVSEEIKIFYRNLDLLRNDWLLATGAMDLAESTMDNYEFKDGKVLVNYNRITEIMKEVSLELRELDEEYGKMVMSAMNQRML